MRLSLLTTMLVLSLFLAATERAAGQATVAPTDSGPPVGTATPAALQPTVLEIVVPEGTAEMMEMGMHPMSLPAVIHLKTGDQIKIVNQDLVPHMMLYQFIPPGETATMTFKKAGIFAFSSGCAIDLEMNSFTTIVVRTG